MKAKAVSSNFAEVMNVSRWTMRCLLPYRCKHAAVLTDVTGMPLRALVFGREYQHVG